MADGSEAERDWGTGLGTRCGVSLMTRDLDEAQRFYGAVMGWRFEQGRLGEDFVIAYRADGLPAASIGGLASTLQVAVAWTPFFAVEDIDTITAKIRERSGTVAVGPLGLPSGRAALAADRDGAVFGLWEDAGIPGRVGERSIQAWLRLRTRDAFDAAIFYGEVLGWGSGRQDGCDVQYEQEEVVVRCDGHQLARINSGAVEAAPDPLVRPLWHVHFPVEDLQAALRAVESSDAVVSERRETADGREATVRDPGGAVFTIADAGGGRGSAGDTAGGGG
ncbi:VOC family protein [Streptomyces tsukubensis]|uniref:Bleomycin resistance protein n=1 Tax=Streptomyces tsukubensis TaxID=83656 RepID=A0A1V4AG34_9ACTN|nr:VOC family protein [Streptomyces tsukubensis]OON82986.1 bleomycin resistance protein [Streptomyces tsukubensis]QFR92218.1 VOC family protein [Streptomyces tsukubensis]